MDAEDHGPFVEVKDKRVEESFSSLARDLGPSQIFSGVSRARKVLGEGGSTVEGVEPFSEEGDIDNSESTKADSF